MECGPHKAVALKQQKIDHPLYYFKAAILNPCLQYAGVGYIFIYNMGEIMPQTKSASLN